MHAATRRLGEDLEEKSLGNLKSRMRQDQSLDRGVSFTTCHAARQKWFRLGSEAIASANSGRCKIRQIAALPAGRSYRYSEEIGKTVSIVTVGAEIDTSDVAFRLVGGRRSRRNSFCRTKGVWGDRSGSTWNAVWARSENIASTYRSWGRL